MEYRDLPAAKAYSLLSPGGLIWVCTRSADGRYDLAPIAWNCPLDYEPTSRILFVCDPKHQTFANLIEKKEFAVALPASSQLALAEKTGSVSGRDRDKYEEFGIESAAAVAVDARIPAGVAAWLECSLIRTVSEGSVAIVLGEVLRASSVADAWKLRLHYVSETLSYEPGRRIG
jgi:flavin reductase (DIM6/NTAB) family NADH-FMN oxidoreductase RutF